MKKPAIITFTLLVAASVIVASGCGRKPTYGPSTTSITAAVDSEFVIELPSNRTTGYQWQLTKPVDQDVVKLVTSSYEPSKSGRLGAGGTERWTFRAVGKGKTAIALEYRRPWEKTRPALQTRTVSITVR